MAPNVLKPILVRCRFNRVSFDVSAAWLPAATTHYPWAGTQRSIGDKLPEQGAFDRVPLTDQDLVGLRVGDHFGTPGRHSGQATISYASPTSLKARRSTGAIGA